MNEVEVPQGLEFKRIAQSYEEKRDEEAQRNKH